MTKAYDLDEKKIIDMFLHGCQIKDIAKEYNVCYSTIKNRLKKNGIPMRNRTEAHTIHKFDEGKMIKMYLNGMTLKDIGEHFNVSYGTIRARLVNHNIPIRSKSEVKKMEFKEFLPNRHGRKYSFNLNFFKEWSENMAYIVGFIAADGYISEKGYLRISIQRRDRSLLEQINYEMESTYPIKDIVSKIGNREYLTSEICIHSVHLINDLIAIGITPRKSLTINMDYIPPKYRLSFTRGYFDGDGSIGEQKTKCSQIPMLRLRICSGSEKILHQIIEVFQTYGVKSVSVCKRKNRNLYEIAYSQNASKKIYDLFYGNGQTIYLERKKNKFDEIIKKQQNT